MKTDSELLSTVPEHICVGTMLKARPQQDAGKRILYIEASNEDVDRQDEVVLQKALLDSADYYLRHGNIDLSHYTILGPKSGIPDYMAYEIGKPVEVKVDGRSTYIKAELYQGDSAMARNAGIVWDSLTKQVPPARWYASVGGSVLSKSVRTDELGNRIAVVDKVRWNNTALDRCPVNRTVGEVSTVPVGVFAKSLNGFVLKTLAAGYGTDAATLDGGSALRQQSLDTGYESFKNKLAGLIRRNGKLKNCFFGLSRQGAFKGGASRDEGLRILCALAEKSLGVPVAQACQWVDRFLTDFTNGEN